MLRTVVYIRKSTDDHEDKQVHSLDRQWKDIQELIEYHNQNNPSEKQIKIMDPEKDIIKEERSAKKIDRPGFNEMIGRIKKWKYDAILATEPSRLSRNPIDTGHLVHCLDQEHIKCIITTKWQFTTSYLDKFTLGLLLSISKYENDLRGENTRSGMSHRASQWATTYQAPMGYRNIGVTKWQRSIEKDGENFQMLQDLWELFLTGKYTVSEIAEKWKEMGITYIASYKNDSLSRQIPSASAYRSMFRNQYYAGKVKSADEWIAGLHPAMITDEMFESAQLLLQKKGYKHSIIQDVKYADLLKGILLCGKTWIPAFPDDKKRSTCPKCKERFSQKEIEACSHCGEVFSEKKWKVEKRRYYSFVKGSEHTYSYNWKSKTTKYIPAEFIESLIEAELAKITVSDGLFRVLKKLMYTEWEKQKKDIRTKIRNCDEIIKELDEKKNNVLDDVYSTDTISPKRKIDLDALVENYDDQIAKKSAEKINMEEEFKETFEKSWMIISTLFEAKTVFSGDPSESFEPKRKLLLSMVSNQKFLDGEIITEWKKPFDMLVTAGTQKQKSQTKSEISAWSSLWLPE